MKILPRISSTGSWIILFTIFALVVINATSFIAYRQMQSLREENDWINHTYKVIQISDNLYYNILLLGISTKAYLLTSEKQYLKEIDNFKIEIFEALCQLKSLTSDNLSQQRRLETFDQIIRNRFAEIENAIQISNTKKFTRLWLIDEVNESSKLTQKMGEIHSQINNEEQRLLALRVRIVNEHSKKVEFFTILGDQFSNIILLLGLGFLLYQLKLRSLAEDKLKHLAYHDGLTGLINRSYLKKRVTESIQIADRHGEKIALLFIDLDNFKDINDEYGHDVGDHVLRVLSQRLLDNIRSIDTVCRLGGDEFVIVLSGIRSKDDIDIALEKIITLIRHEITFDNYRFFLTASIGISLYPEQGTDHRTLMKHADTAMYNAKQSGGNNYQFYKEK